MFSKSKIALAALLVVGANSVAFGFDEPEHRLSDRYPFLEKIDRSPAAPDAFMRSVRIPQNAKLPQFASEEPEHKVSDLYPFLEQIDRSTTTPNVVTGTVQRNAKLPQFAHEEPEHKVSDLYPFLEQITPVATAMRNAKPVSSGQKASLVRRSLRSVN